MSEIKLLVIVIVIFYVFVLLYFGEGILEIYANALN